MGDEAFKRRQKQAMAAFKAVVKGAGLDVGDAVVERAAADPNLQMYVHDPKHMEGVLQEMATKQP